MSDQFENTLLSNLIHNEDFTRKALPFIKADLAKEWMGGIVATDAAPEFGFGVAALHMKY